MPGRREGGSEAGRAWPGSPVWGSTGGFIEISEAGSAEAPPVCPDNDGQGSLLMCLTRQGRTTSVYRVHRGRGGRVPGPRASLLYRLGHTAMGCVGDRTGDPGSPWPQQGCHPHQAWL